MPLDRQRYYRRKQRVKRNEVAGSCGFQSRVACVWTVELVHSSLRDQGALYRGDSRKQLEPA